MPRIFLPVALLVLIAQTASASIFECVDVLAAERADGPLITRRRVDGEAQKALATLTNALKGSDPNGDVAIAKAKVDRAEANLQRAKLEERKAQQAVAWNTFLEGGQPGSAKQITAVLGDAFNNPRERLALAEAEVQVALEEKKQALIQLVSTEGNVANVRPQAISQALEVLRPALQKSASRFFKLAMFDRRMLSGQAEVVRIERAQLYGEVGTILPLEIHLRFRRNDTGGVWEAVMVMHYNTETGIIDRIGLTNRFAHDDGLRLDIMELFRLGTVFENYHLDQPVANIPWQRKLGRLRARLSDRQIEALQLRRLRDANFRRQMDNVMTVALSTRRPVEYQLIESFFYYWAFGPMSLPFMPSTHWLIFTMLASREVQLAVAEQMVRAADEAIRASDPALQGAAGVPDGPVPLANLQERINEVLEQAGVTNGNPLVLAEPSSVEAATTFSLGDLSPEVARGLASQLVSAVSLRSLMQEEAGAGSVPLIVAGSPEVALVNSALAEGLPSSSAVAPRPDSGNSHFGLAESSPGLDARGSAGDPLAPPANGLLDLPVNRLLDVPGAGLTGNYVDLRPEGAGGIWGDATGVEKAAMAVGATAAVGAAVGLAVAPAFETRPSAPEPPAASPEPDRSSGGTSGPSGPGEE